MKLAHKVVSRRDPVGRYQWCLRMMQHSRKSTVPDQTVITSVKIGLGSHQDLHVDVHSLHIRPHSTQLKVGLPPLPRIASWRMRFRKRRDNPFALMTLVMVNVTLVKTHFKFIYV